MECRELSLEIVDILYPFILQLLFLFLLHLSTTSQNPSIPRASNSAAFSIVTRVRIRRILIPSHLNAPTTFN